MPPQQRQVIDEPKGGGMRRVTSESDMSDAGATSGEYRVRKSRLIG